MDKFPTEILRIVVGHCSQSIGWNGIQVSSLDLLTDLIHKYLIEMGSLAHRYAEQFGRTEPNLDDISLTFREMGITIQDLSDYVSNVEPSSLHNDNLPKLPIRRENYLNFLKPGSSEVIARPVHVYEHLPPMHHIFLEEHVVEDSLELNENISPSAVFDIGESTPLRSTLFKRPDSCADKKKSIRHEEDGQELRELSSVMMTSSGFISSSREGKLPEIKVDSACLGQETNGFEHQQSIDKKIPIKKMIEGINKLDDGEKKSVDKESEKNLEQEQIKEGKEKEKVKKKRIEKVMEEFAFFDKEKPPICKALSTEMKPFTDTTKQKLVGSIFRKNPKTAKDGSESTGSGVHSPSENFTQPSSIVGEIKSSLHHTSDTSTFKNISKKEQKMKILKFGVDGTKSPETKEKERKSIPQRDKSSVSWMASEDVMELEERPSSSIDKLMDEKQVSNHSQLLGPTKKKRGRPAKVTLTQEIKQSQIPLMQETNAVTTTGSSAISANPFYPFPSHFPVPGLIPPPLFQNVPFNLLGMPLGLRPTLTSYPSQGGTSLCSNPSNAITPVFLTSQRGDAQSKATSPKKTPTHIVDSLPESTPTGESSVNLPMNSHSDAEQPTSKKEKRERKDKEKKKKDKKLKVKNKDDEGDRKIKKEKKKEKKDKSKDREDIAPSTVPKITFKFGVAPISPRPLTPESTPKLVFKPMVDREASTSVTIAPVRETTSPSLAQASSVDVAKFSALVTRPPKAVKAGKKDQPMLDKQSLNEEKMSSPIPEQNLFGTAVVSGVPNSRREKPHKPPKITKEKEKEKKKMEKPGDVAVITETVGSYYDEFGNKIWICPACGRQDDGTPMIGCDECDDWYHWVCVGIRVPPAETESWFCQRCIAKKQGSFSDKKKIRKKKIA